MLPPPWRWLLVLCLLACACRRPAPGPGAGRVDGTQALAALHGLCALGPRFPGAAGYEPALGLLRSALAEHADVVEVRDFTSGGTRFHNVVARFRPAARPRILLGTHWDTRIVADEDPSPARRRLPTPGANDGTSGVAVLLELAPHLKRLPAGAPGVDVVLFDAEESRPPSQEWVVGSKAFAARLPDPGVYQAALVLDMVCRKEPPIRREVLSERHAPWLVDLVFDTAAKVAPSGPFVDTKGLRVRDDHTPLLGRGIPAVLLIGYGDPAWHTAQDTPDRCDAAVLGAVGDVVLRVVELLAERGGPSSLRRDSETASGASLGAAAEAPRGGVPARPPSIGNEGSGGQGRARRRERASPQAPSPRADRCRPAG